MQPLEDERRVAEARAPWRREAGLQALLKRWQSDPRIWRNVVLHRTLEARQARSAPVPGLHQPPHRPSRTPTQPSQGAVGRDGPQPAWPRPVLEALAKRGIEALYTHQLRAMELASEGRDVVVATPTASGKSLCYNLPVLEALSQQPDARALYLFPTKALARDQEQALRALVADAELSQGVVTYDGDTPADARRAARQRAGLVLTNPDMLHAGILPHHTAWARLFSNLRYVIVDELHTYRGVFGSHLANVLRRVERVARFHGSRPVYLFASATIGNPAEHASRMLGRPVQPVEESGAPQGRRHVLVYNPPVVNAELGIRQSYLKVAVRLTSELLRAGVSTLVFGQSRNGVEVMLKYLRERLRRDRLDPQAVQAYRGGYLPETRRRIEADLREGRVGCVVATNALELGIDIGSLDAVVCAGYPGSIAGLWQRFGRAGRRMDDSAAFLVTSSAPLDQYFASDAEKLLGAPVEQARIDPDNIEILVQHLKCAAFELPFEAAEGFGDVPAEAVEEALGFLAQHRVLHPVEPSPGKRVYHWASDAYPANHVSLRSVGWDNFVIVDVERERTFAEMDWRATHTMLHEQAIYQHGGEQFQVERLDFDNHKAFVRNVVSDYYTEAMTYTRVSVLEPEEQAMLQGVDAVVPQGVLAGHGEVSVIEKVIGYKKIKYFTHENVGYGDVRLPEMQMHTSSLWLTFDETVVQAQRVTRPVVLDALRGLAHALHTVAAVALMIDPRDLGRTLGDRTDRDELPGKGRTGGPGFDPTIFVYDHVPGGVGLAPRLFDERERLLRRARRLIETCACTFGCPACVGASLGSQDAGAVGSGEPGPDMVPAADRKQLALEILRAVGVPSLH